MFGNLLKAVTGIVTLPLDVAADVITRRTSRRLLTRTNPMKAEEIAAGLNERQRAYIVAVAESESPYTARHGRTANWALNHKYVDTVIRLSDGREGVWESFDVYDRIETGISEILGQRLTPLGLAVREALMKEKGNG